MNITFFLLAAFLFPAGAYAELALYSSTATAGNIQPVPPALGDITRGLRSSTAPATYYMQPVPPPIGDVTQLLSLSSSTGAGLLPMPAVPLSPEVFKSSGPAGLEDGLRAEYDAALLFDASGEEPAAKAVRWRELAGKCAACADIASSRAGEWERYAAAQNAFWAAMGERNNAIDREWSGLLPKLSAAGTEERGLLAGDFVRRYGLSLRENPRLPDAVPYLSTASLDGREWYGVARDMYVAGRPFAAAGIMKRLADGGDNVAAARHALYQCHGVGMAKNAEAGARFVAEHVAVLEKEADYGNHDARGILGALYASGCGVERDISLARGLLFPDTPSGDIMDLRSFVMFVCNEEKSPYLCGVWARKGADMGDPASAFVMAVAYYRGNGVKRNRQASLTWARRAVDGGMPRANVMLGYLYGEGGGGIQQDYVMSARYHALAAQAGETDAMYPLGWLYLYGFGVGKDEDRAAEYFRRGAEAGDAYSQAMMGYVYQNGIGVWKDSRAAAKWYAQAGEQGEISSQNNLGVMLMSGDGVEKDYKTALKWFRRAAAGGSVSARCWLGKIYLEGDGVARDAAESYAWYKLAAAGGCESAPAGLEAARSSLKKPGALEKAEKRFADLSSGRFD